MINIEITLARNVLDKQRVVDSAKLKSVEDKYNSVKSLYLGVEVPTLLPLSFHSITYIKLLLLFCSFHSIVFTGSQKRMLELRSENEKARHS